MKKVTGMINAKRKMGKINKEIYGHFSEHLEDVSMREFLWERILRSLTQME